MNEIQRAEAEALLARFDFWIACTSTVDAIETSDFEAATSYTAASTSICAPPTPSISPWRLGWGPRSSRSTSAWRLVPERSECPFSNLDHSHLTQSAHLGGGSLPQGMRGTDEVEFFGLPSMILSE